MRLAVMRIEKRSSIFMIFTFYHSRSIATFYEIQTYPLHILSCELFIPLMPIIIFCFFIYPSFLLLAARKQEIIRSTELLLDAISSGDFESYSYVSLTNHNIHLVLEFVVNLKRKDMFLLIFASNCKLSRKIRLTMSGKANISLHAQK